ncbi:M56 family metallopeptidase [Prescottella sp. R16]|uniref:M56 family metallopeptidase n=1 Tax=Prescottella sp. R16 TaxID=3064529 RepID=UPI00272EBD55|nr:M56 family metallopeptidase [Prescottella sp. R16]
MIAGLALAVAAAVLAVIAPRWLGRLAAPHRHPRIALAAWVTSQCVFVGVVAAIPVVLWVRPGGRWHVLPAATLTCMQSLRETGALPWLAAVEAVLCTVGLAVTARTVLVVARRLLRHRRLTESHASALRLIAGPSATDGEGVFRLGGADFAAYSIGGRSPAIVLGTAVAALDPDARAAVLAHERAHLTGRHHLLVAWSDALRAALPGVPLAYRGATWTRVLVELSADRQAAVSCGSGAVCAALGHSAAAGRDARPAALSVSGTGLAADRMAWLSAVQVPRSGAQALHYPVAVTVSVLPVLASTSVVVAALALFCAVFGG